LVHMINSSMDPGTKMNMAPITLALIAHDNKKEEMLSLVTDRLGELANLSLVATRSTGMLIQSRTGLNVTLMQSGPMGGDQQIGALVASCIVRAVIFLRDPLTVQPHEPDVSALLGYATSTTSRWPLTRPSLRRCSTLYSITQRLSEICP